MSSPATHVQLSGVSKTFGAKLALNGIHLDITPGQFTVLLGPSGSGKTTLLRILAGIERPSSGRIQFGSLMVVAPGQFLPPEKRRLAMVFQDYALWPHMTVARNVAFPLDNSTSTKLDRKSRVVDLLRRVGIEHLSERYPNELSGGEQQRVALARALAADVGLILFDEPLSNLDADRRESLRIEIATLARESGATVVYITHDQSEAFALADVVGVLNHGDLVQWGSPEAIYRSPATPFVARFTGLAGELPVRVHRVAEGRAAIQFNSPSESVEMINCPSNCDSVGDATMFVRPAAVSLTSESGVNRISVAVEDSAFIGRGYEHVVTFDGGRRFTKIFSASRFARGTRAFVEINPDAVFIMKEVK